MSSVRLHIDGKDLQVNGRFQYTRQVADIGDIETSNSNHTNSFSIIRDNNSTRAFKGLGLNGSESNIPYSLFGGKLYVEEIPVLDNNGWAKINETNQSNFKVSIIDGNIDFWKAIEGVTLADIDLSEANYSKTREGIIDSFTSPYQKYLIGYYAKDQTYRDGYDINLLNPAISEKYIFDQIFAHIGMTYELSPVIDSWLVIGRSPESAISSEMVIYIEALGGVRIHPYNANINQFDFTFENEYFEDASFNETTQRIEIEKAGNYKFDVNWTTLEARYGIQERGQMPYIIDLPIDHFIEVNGIRYNFNEEIYLQPSDLIYLRFRPIDNQRLKELGIDGSIISVLEATSWDYYFDMSRLDVVRYSFSDELGKMTAKEFVKQIMHRYALTLFYENRKATFLTIDERLSADVEDLDDYFVEVENEKYVFLDYAQYNYLKMKYADDGDDFNDGVLSSDNVNLDFEKAIIESFTYSQDINGVMEMWTFKGQDVPYEQIKGRYFSVRADVRWETIQLRDGLDSIPSYVGDIAFVVFEETGFRYFGNIYYKGFENKILKRSKMQNVKLDMPFSKFINLDLKKVFYIQQENFLINKITYKGLRDVEAEIVKIH